MEGHLVRASVDGQTPGCCWVERNHRRHNSSPFLSSSLVTSPESSVHSRCWGGVLQRGVWGTAISEGHSRSRLHGPVNAGGRALETARELQ